MKVGLYLLLMKRSLQVFIIGDNLLIKYYKNVIFAFILITQNPLHLFLNNENLKIK